MCQNDIRNGKTDGAGRTLYQVKLTFVTETFPPEINGVAMTLGRLVGGLAVKGVEVKVVAPHRPDRTSRSGQAFVLQEVPGLPIPRYPELRFGIPASRRLRRYWSGDRPDILHVATEGPLGWSALRTARHLDLPVVSSFHTNFHTYGGHYGYGLLTRPALAWMRHFHNQTLRTFVPSSDVVEKLQAERFDRIRLLPRGVDTRLFNPARRSQDLRLQWGAGPDTPVAIYVGRLAGEKNISLVLEAFQCMRKTLPDLKMVFVGDGPERSKLEKRCRGAVFAGMQEGEALATHYASADCFPFASITETFGNVVTEAMASGLAVLAYDYAAPARFIENGKNGLMVPFNDEAAFLQGADALAAARRLWPEWGLQARATMLPHSWESIVDEYLEELSTLPEIQSSKAKHV